MANAFVADWERADEDPLAPMARAAARGDEIAARSLLEEVGPSVFSVVEAVLGRAHADVDDVAQDAFVAILRALESFRFESSVLHFVRRVALRRASATLRHARAIRRASASTVTLDEDAHLESPSASPLDAMITARQMALVRGLVVELPDEQAETLLLRVVLGHSVEEISEATHTPVNTVKSRLRAARATFRERIAADTTLAELGGEGT
jgi:RNA polymerase sigma-70 factor (ECF subfamily)